MTKFCEFPPRRSGCHPAGVRRVSVRPETGIPSAYFRCSRRSIVNSIPSLTAPSQCPSDGWRRHTGSGLPLPVPSRQRGSSTPKPSLPQGFRGIPSEEARHISPKGMVMESSAGIGPSASRPPKGMVRNVYFWNHKGEPLDTQGVYRKRPHPICQVLKLVQIGWGHSAYLKQFS